MALSCPANRSSSCGVSSSRASRATWATCSGVSAMAAASEVLGQLERLALDRPGHQAGADRRGGDAQPLHLAVDHDLDLLEVRLELPLGNAGDLLADAAQVLGLAAVGLLIADRRLLAGDRTLLAHDRVSRGAPGGPPDILSKCSL